MSSSIVPVNFWMPGSLLLGLLMEIYPWSIFAAGWQPQWLLLAVTFWVLCRPQQFGIFLAFMVGLLLDVVVGDVVGRYALSFCLSIYLLKVVQQRLHYSTALHQALLVFVLAVINASVAGAIDHWALDVSVPSRSILLSALITACLWPLVQLPLRRLSSTD